MDIEAFKKFYIDPISLGPEDMPQALPQIFKDRSILKIAADESDFKTRNIVTFQQKNLDIITLPSEAYIYVQLGIEGTFNSLTDKDISIVANHNFEDELTRLYSSGIPATTGLIDGFDYKINDTSIDQHNNSLSSALYAINNGVFSPENRVEAHIGLADYTKGPVWYQVKKTGNTQEWKIPLKYFIPFLKENKILWGVKQTLVLTKQTVFHNIFTCIGDPAVSTDAITKINYNKIELHMPYVKLENSKQLALWNSMYASKVDRYWLGNEQFLSGPVDNDKPHNNEIFRIATKGLNSHPRYLLVHAITTESGTLTINPYLPMGFPTSYAATTGGEANTLRVKKLRVKLNGIYIDNGDVLEMSVPESDVNASSDPRLTSTGYLVAYERYCKFFGQLGSASVSPVSFDKWLENQIYVFDLTNIDAESVFSNSGNAIIVELEYSTATGCTTANTQFKWAANLLHDKTLSIEHKNNTAYIVQS